MEIKFKKKRYRWRLEDMDGRLLIALMLLGYVIGVMALWCFVTIAVVTMG